MARSPTGVVDTLDGLGIGASTPKIAESLGLLLGVVLVWGFYRLGIEGARSVGGNLSPRKLEHGFVHSLVPIAAVYVAAHYLTFLIFEGQAISYLAQRPVRPGLGPVRHRRRGRSTTRSSRRRTPGTCRSRWSSSATWRRWRSRTTARSSIYGDAKLAVRSQYWMLGVMVGFTSLALWLLAQAGS